MYDHKNFKYCTLFVCRTELRTDGQTDRQTDDPNTICPRRTFQAGGIKIYFKHKRQSQGHKVIDLGVILKDIISGICISFMNENVFLVYHILLAVYFCNIHRHNPITQI